MSRKILIGGENVCSICLQTPCAARCPNAPEPKAVYKCAYCGEGIIADEEYIEYDGSYYHADCVSGMTVKELCEAFDLKLETAYED